MSRAALWRGPRGKELREASGQQPVRNQALDPTSHEEENPANKHKIDIGS